MSDSDRLVPISSTFCLDCVFAEYDENNKQTGCRAGRLEQFRNANIPISDITHDNTTSYIIEGKACIYYRNKEWAHEKYKGKDDQEIFSIVQQQLNIPYHAIVFLRKDDNIDDAKMRLSELEQQKVKPKIVTLVDRSHSEVAITPQLLQLFNKYSFAYWRVQTVQATDQTDIQVVDLIYDSTKQIPFMFYICFESRSPIPSEFSEEIHTAVQDNMQAFTVLLPNADNVGGGALKVAHAKHAGNSFDIPLETKIIHYDDAPHLIKKVEDICPSLQTS
tara:strand:+ start:599 stop:1426 length:828 start_codon:yes stop_codon:yes gene_type:complete